MHAPVEFVVARHLLTHPEDAASDMARHCHLHRASASRAQKRLRKRNLLTAEQQVLYALQLPHKPAWKTYTFRVPNPDLWLRGLRAPAWLSGEAAAAIEGMDLVPSQVLAYVQADALPAALEAAKRAFAKVSSERDANLLIRVADPWLHLDPDERLVERGQRLLDYAVSLNVQFAKEWARLG